MRERREGWVGRAGRGDKPVAVESSTFREKEENTEGAKVIKILYIQSMKRDRKKGVVVSVSKW